MKKVIDEKVAVLTTFAFFVFGIFLGMLILGLAITRFAPLQGDERFYAIDYSLGGAPHIDCGTEIACANDTCTCDTNSIVGYNWIAVRFNGFTKEKIDELQNAFCDFDVERGDQK